MLSKGQAIFQGIYIFLFVFSSFLIFRKLGLGEPMPKFLLIVYGISIFLTYGKIIYVNCRNYIYEEGNSNEEI